MKTKFSFILLIIFLFYLVGCSPVQVAKEKTAATILGKPNYLAISYGGYRYKTRDIEPTIAQLKEDMKILEAMHVKILRTYNTKLQETPNLLEAICQLKKEDPNFEMYVMLGAWIDCENAWTDKTPNHNVESLENNTAEINRAVAYAQQYPGIVKIIAVGNEAMVKWATSYYVQPAVILKWVNYLQDLKKAGKLSKDLWITSSDNFASWGGGSAEYHTADLTKLMKAVDYISLHTYPYHDTHYNPVFWNTPKNTQLSKGQQIEAAMLRAKNYAVSQYRATVKYMKSLGINKPIHIGETGWATVSNGFCGPTDSKASDEFKQKLYYNYMREWTYKNNMACFYFEAFDEQWKDSNNPEGSENHFGLINLKGQVKYALWNLIDEGAFKGLTRDGIPLTKTYNGDKNELLKAVLAPPIKE